MAPKKDKEKVVESVKQEEKKMENQKLRIRMEEIEMEEGSIGQGGNASVYKGLFDNRPVAVKVYAPDKRAQWEVMRKIL